MGAMDHPSLAIFGYSEAAMFLRDTPLPKIAGIISIHGRREFGVEFDATPRLDLSFDDVEVVSPNDTVAMQRALARKRFADQNGLAETAPVPGDAASIIEFAEEVGDRAVDVSIVLCHCGAGMSRAPAAALICLAVWRGAGAERDCVEEVVRLRRGAVPHVGLVRFADELLEREGRLLGALISVMRQ
jgi:predicted protein tyrosine phosphatase